MGAADIRAALSQCELLQPGPSVTPADSAPPEPWKQRSPGQKPLPGPGDVRVPLSQSLTYQPLTFPLSLPPLRPVTTSVTSQEEGGVQGAGHRLKDREVPRMAVDRAEAGGSPMCLWRWPGGGCGSGMQGPILASLPSRELGLCLHGHTGSRSWPPGDTPVFLQAPAMKPTQLAYQKTTGPKTGGRLPVGAHTAST